MRNLDIISSSLEAVALLWADADVDMERSLGRVYKDIDLV